MRSDGKRLESRQIYLTNESWPASCWRAPSVYQSVWAVYITLKEARPYQAESLPIVGDQIQCEAVQMVVAWPGQG